MSRRLLWAVLAVLLVSGCHIDPPSDAWPPPAMPEVSTESPKSWVLPGGGEQ